MENKYALTTAGFTAITINTIMLKIARPLGIQAESGGLLKLALQYLPGSIGKNRGFKTQWFWLSFHYGTGAVMVILFYFFFARLHRTVLEKGLLFSMLPWLVNGLVVLPLLNQGIFGINTIPASGIIYYLAANLAFGIALSWFYDYFRACIKKSRF